MPMFGPRLMIRSLRCLFTVLLVVGSVAKLFLDEKLIRREHHQNEGGGGGGPNGATFKHTHIYSGWICTNFKQRGSKRRPNQQNQNQQ
jgi:hypothetical protein